MCNYLAAAPRFSEFDTFLFVIHDEIGFGSGRATISLLVISHFRRLQWLGIIVNLNPKPNRVNV
jgi:hypothetical protein